MYFNFFRFFINLAIESYIISMILFWCLKNYYPPFRNQKTAVLNRFNLIGMGLGVLALMDEIWAVIHIPVRNVEIHSNQPYWFLFRTISIIGLLVAILFFITAKRSGKAIRTIAGIAFLWMPALVHPFESWATASYYGRSIPIVYYPLCFSKETWWICLLLVAVILVINANNGFRLLKNDLGEVKYL